MTVVARIEGPGCGCEADPLASPLIGLDAALVTIARAVRPLDQVQSLPLARACGRVLARPVSAAEAAPPFDSAAMDGYALCASALAGGGPWRLPVVARLAAGQAPAAPLSGAGTVRILTGAPMPPGADTVVAQEDVTREGDAVVLRAPPAPGAHVRRRGEDMEAGEVVLPAGTMLDARAIAAAAAAGRTRVEVARPVRVALLVTGRELRRPGAGRGAAQIADVNTPMLRAAIAGPAARLVAVRRCADDPGALSDALEGLAARADLVVTTGGLSVGEEDFVKPALIAAGGRVVFGGVALKPGKPVSFGRLGGAFWLGLPGNPVSAFVTWQLFGTALLRALTGQGDSGPGRRHVVLGGAIRRKPGRCELRPATLAGFDAQGREVARCDAATHPARLTPLAGADGLLFLPAETAHLPAGALVEFLPFSET